MKKLIMIFILSSVLVSKIEKTHAYWGVFDFNVQDVPNIISTTATQYNTSASTFSQYQVYFKEYVADYLAKVLARQAIAQLEQQSINWINSGFKGKPLFIQNPELFFKNIAVDELTLIKDDILYQVSTTSNNISNAAKQDARNIAKFTISQLANQAAIQKDRLSTNTQRYICDKLKAEVDLGLRSSQEYRNGAYYKEKKAQYNSVCLGIAPSLPANASGITNLSNITSSYNINKCLIDFSCSGWSGILAATQDFEKNSATGRAEESLRQALAKTEKKSLEAKEEVRASGGYLNQKKCLQQKTIQERTVCIRQENVNLGKTAESAADQAVRTPTQENIAADELKEAFGNIANAFVSKMIKDGVGYVAGAFEGAANELDLSLDTLNRDLNVSLARNADNLVNNVVNNNANNNNNNNTAEGFAQSEVNDIKNQVIFTLKPQIKITTDNNEKELRFLEKELLAYKKLMSAYTEVATCYKEKEAYTNAEGYTPRAAYPANIPADIRKKAENLDIKIKTLEAIKTKSIAAEAELLRVYREFVDLTDINKIQNLTTLVLDATRNEDLLLRGEWEVRDSKNSIGEQGNQSTIGADSSVIANFLKEDSYGLYIKIETEIEETIKGKLNPDNREGESYSLSPLAACKMIQDPATISNN